MEDSSATLMPTWRANLALLTREVGAVTRLARMMTFSASYMKLIASGQRDFSAEFVRGVEAVTGLPEGWMDEPHGAGDVPQEARDAIADETPQARFRGTAHPVRKAPVLRTEPIFGHGADVRRAQGTAAQDAQRRVAGTRKLRELAAQDVRKLERHLSMLPVEPEALRLRIEDVIAHAEYDERARADIEGRLEQIEKHRELLLRHITRLHALLARSIDD
ncbi:hypothetical protein [Paraburkholderia tagetis]|uniref:Uncharacterized protein n=1 Tax=Paraburkholderia tagetis TaxID=2913261 RepID=A0A9X1RPK9_9BURK|nr:hypothetical protein [Paraburkholderia tagetis]MCG5073979.1 hypothetical protein [Paraburkholderia tagetis]